MENHRSEIRKEICLQENDTLFQETHEAEETLSRVVEEIKMMTLESENCYAEDPPDCSGGGSKSSIQKMNELVQQLFMVVTNWGSDYHALNAISSLEKIFEKINKDGIRNEVGSQESALLRIQSTVNQRYNAQKETLVQSQPSVKDDLVQVCQNLMDEREELLSEIIEMKKSYNSLQVAKCNAILAESNKKIAMANIELDTKKKRMFVIFCSILKRENNRNQKWRAFMTWKVLIFAANTRSGRKNK